MSDPSLEELLGRVVRARAVQKEQQSRQLSSPSTVANARWDVLRALEAYVAALDERRWPVPRQIHQELQLQRSLCGVAAPGSRAQRHGPAR